MIIIKHLFPVEEIADESFRKWIKYPGTTQTPIVKLLRTS